MGRVEFMLLHLDDQQRRTLVWAGLAVVLTAFDGSVLVLALLSGLGTGITVISYPLVAPNWRWLFLAGGLGVLVAPLIWWRLPEGRTWLGARVSGSALRLLFEPAWRRPVLVIAAVTALLAVPLETAGPFFTGYAHHFLRPSPT